MLVYDSMPVIALVQWLGAHTRCRKQHDTTEGASDALTE
jgi:hypothetical protein